MFGPAPARYVVPEVLLRRAVAGGRISGELRGDVEREVVALASVSRVVLCTCSTLGPIDWCARKCGLCQDMGNPCLEI